LADRQLQALTEQRQDLDKAIDELKKLREATLAGGKPA
jgi:hypothetical protein